MILRTLLAGVAATVFLSFFFPEYQIIVLGVSMIILIIYVIVKDWCADGEFRDINNQIDRNYRTQHDNIRAVTNKIQNTTEHAISLKSEVNTLGGNILGLKDNELKNSLDIIHTDTEVLKCKQDLQLLLDVLKLQFVRGENQPENLDKIVKVPQLKKKSQ